MLLDGCCDGFASTKNWFCKRPWAMPHTQKPPPLLAVLPLSGPQIRPKTTAGWKPPASVCYLVGVGHSSVASSTRAHERMGVGPAALLLSWRWGGCPCCLCQHSMAKVVGFVALHSEVPVNCGWCEYGRWVVASSSFFCVKSTGA